MVIIYEFFLSSIICKTYYVLWLWVNLFILLLLLSFCFLWKLIDYTTFTFIRQIDLRGSLLQTIYQIGSLPKLFMNEVYFYMHPAICIGDKAKPSLALATYRLTWRVFRQQHCWNNCWCQKEQAWSRYHG